MSLVNRQPVSYLQTDARWKNIPYAVKGENSTIGGSGCGPTAMAMVLATWADPSVTPKSECAWALNHKPSFKALNQGTYYGYFVPAAARYGLECRQITPGYIYGNANSPYHEEARKALDRGDFVIACMGKGTWTRSGHFVLVWGVEGNIVYINDPASTSLMRTRGNYQVFRKQVKHYWIIKRPARHPLTEPVSYRDVDFAVRVTDRTGLNCRKEPSLSGEVVKVYALGTEVRISKTTSNGWGRTDKGWINLTNTERVKEMTEKETIALVSKMMAEQLEGLRNEIGKIVPVTYHNEKEIPEWYQSAYNKVKDGIKGRSEDDLDLPEMMIRIFTVLDRVGKL